MKKGSLVIAVAVVCFGAWVSSAFAVDKIGYVDVGKLFDEYPKTKEYDKNLESKSSLYEKDRDAKISEIKQMQEKLSLLSDAEKEKKEKELQDKIKSVKDFAFSKESDLKKERDDRLKEVLNDIEGAVKQYAQKEGYTMVFNDRVFMYKTNVNDITDKVLEVLQSGYKKSAPPAAAVKKAN
ncbi:MAG: hypothetical protein A2Y00_11120 [Omnitrophica WOR_2 bacterium GWF2_43_52]|nr:MAG: hypothetical protein A2062_00580 [Omnitrophica WOR_2 bacterium GWA2_44_7]OGX17988.1 MAG: hypothetical protein A2Y01_03855 [Omnitrophica WOR_2 bacterium GWC2_44_8]OGX20834.1 MAG: hypothetical protein A2Y00_11120 [Omnitrophica WOR_2 bacterium GWF2_43_52]OGX54713.1 MAG: hypothetical protein A2460_04390 [Omnitrophica WOR_2 bacterium RIFOXYC2_FULL_43_9]HAH19867.1 hypothetical protein [Candidatus Omnitrophota bacterium]